MSLDLQDVGAIKVHPEVHAMLKAQAYVDRIEMNVLIRDLLHDWATKQNDARTMAEQLAKAKGLSGISGDWK